MRCEPVTFRMTILPVVLLVIFVGVSPPAYTEVLSWQVLQGVGSFYGLEEGTVAYLPIPRDRKGAEETIEFRVLPESGKYSLNKKPSHWFLVNHRTGDRSKTTYLGVLIIPVYPHDQTPDFGVFLQRNSGWKRENAPAFKTGEIKETYEEKTIHDFISAHTQPNLTEMDSRFRPLQWHGIPKFGKSHSWAKRARWKHDLIVNGSMFRASFSPPIPESANMLLKAYLLRFTPTHRPESENRLIFKFSGKNVIAAHVKLFSPNSPEYDSQYFLSFK